MSKIRIIGGDLIENIGGSYKIYAGEGIEISSNKEVVFNAKEGIKYGEPQEPQLQKLNDKINCALHFRPPKKWNGEFGFDFYRNGDKEMDNNINYSILLGKYYMESSFTNLNENVNDWTDFFKPTPDVLKNSNEFSKFSYQLNNISKTYYTPYLALFPSDLPNTITEVALNCYLEGDLPEKIEFEIPQEMKVSISPTTIIKIENKFEIKVKCTGNFSSDIQPIKVYGSKKIDENEIKEEIGRLSIIAPSKILSKKIVIVRVKTGFLSKGSVSNSILKKFQKLTKQALIDIEITAERKNQDGKMVSIELDVRKPENNYQNIDFKKTFKENGVLSKRDGLNTFLINQLNMTFNNEYQDYFKLFLIPENFITGYVQDKESGEKAPKVLKAYTQINVNWAIFFQGIEEETLTHELFHAFGLYHSFGNDSTYTFKALETGNIMDYSNWSLDKKGNQRNPKERYYTWYWQWKIINPNI